MKYIFILGRIPVISVAEVLSVFKREKIGCKIADLSREVLAVDLDGSIKDEQSFLNKLGGTIKIIEVFGEVNKVSDLRDVLNADTLMDRYPYIKKETENIPLTKFYWGVSVYFICEARLHTKQKIAREIISYLIGVKETFRERLIRCRIVTPPPGKLVLDSPAIIKNNLIEKGGEVAIAVDKTKIYWGKTLAAQDFKAYELRDYGRPSRSMKTGMMPPKLAQVMINLSTTPPEEKILDPFCGTGVILQEALLMGYKAVGADKSKEAIAATRGNVEWLAEKLKEKSICLLENAEYLQLFQADAKEIGKVIPENSIGAIVTEGTLGPRYGRDLPSVREISRNFETLEKIYLPAFAEFKRILKNNGRIAITFPVYLKNQLAGRRFAFAPFLDKISNLGYNILSPIENEKIRNNPLFSLSERGTMVYSRPDQIVGREIVIFGKK